MSKPKKEPHANLAQLVGDVFQEIAEMQKRLAKLEDELEKVAEEAGVDFDKPP